MEKVMKMPRCPNCSYILVLLEERGKYKCAKCSKLFLKKEVEDKEFRELNKQQRENDKKEFNKQLKLRRKILKPRKMVDPIEQQKKVREYGLTYYYRNRRRILTARKKAYRENKDSFNEARNKYRKNHINETRIMWRLDYWRRMQKEIVMETLLY